MRPNELPPVHLCEECLTLHSRVTLVMPDHSCRRCGHSPVPGVLNVSDVRAIIQSWQRNPGAIEL
jgi:hypothetical protein